MKPVAAFQPYKVVMWTALLLKTFSCVYVSRAPPVALAEGCGLRRHFVSSTRLPRTYVLGSVIEPFGLVLAIVGNRQVVAACRFRRERDVARLRASGRPRLKAAGFVGAPSAKHAYPGLTSWAQ